MEKAVIIKRWFSAGKGERNITLKAVGQGTCAFPCSEWLKLFSTLESDPPSMEKQTVRNQVQLSIYMWVRKQN
jgi:hypothetical protein